ncbi:MAG TPA: M13 family metallopeptidase [Chitinophagaceae bacterium]
MERCLKRKHLLFLALFIISDKALSQTSFIDRQSFDTSVSPGDNFFRYVSGGWLKKPDFPNKDWSGDWGGFITVQYKSNQKLNKLLDSISKKTFIYGTAEQKVSDFVKSVLDTASVNKASYSLLKPIFKKIDAAETYQELIPIIGELAKESGERLLGFMVWPDDRNSKISIAKFTQGGLTFWSSFSNYSRTDSIGIRNRNTLVQLIADYLSMIGTEKQKALHLGKEILELEKKIAGSWRTGLQLNDPALNYNKMSVAGARKLAPNLNWPLLLRSMGINSDSINIAQPDYFKALNDLLVSEPLDVWKAKLKFDYLYKTGWNLGNYFSNKKSIYLATIRGTTFAPVKLEDAIADYSMNLKDAVGQIYVKAFMDEKARIVIKEMAENIRETFRERILNAAWMSEKTKMLALHKLNSMIINVGYPDKWGNHDAIQIKEDDFFHNMRSIARHDYKEAIATIDKTYDRRHWVLTPMYVGAQYRWTHNSITLPAALMQFPYFDINADDAVNYGGIGSVIAHEMTHGFDDLGRKYDAEGGLQNWWQSADEENFIARAKTMIDQYAGYVIYDSLRINSALMFNENLADLGGVTLAYESFKKTKQGKGSEKIDGFSPDQRFFIIYALKNRVFSVFTSSIKNSLQTSLHAPYEIRVNGPLSNFQPFYNAFNVTEKHKMYRPKAERVSIW